MYIDVTRSMFYDAFAKYGRAHQFSYDALDAIFERIEDLECDTEARIELDVIALCCDFTEYTPEEIVDLFGDGTPRESELFSEAFGEALSALNDVAFWYQALPNGCCIVEGA